MSTQLNSLGENQFLVVKDINHPRQDLIIDAANLNNNSAPYKVYTALLSQGGKNNPPEGVILENTIGNIVWTYIDGGEYIGILANAFTNYKTFFSACIFAPSLIGIERLDNNRIRIITTNSLGVKDNGLLNRTSIEIRVYN